MGIKIKVEVEIKVEMALHCRVPIVGEQTLSIDEVGVEVLRFWGGSSMLKAQSRNQSFRGYIGTAVLKSATMFQILFRQSIPEKYPRVDRATDIQQKRPETTILRFRPLFTATESCIRRYYQV